MAIPHLTAELFQLRRLSAGAVEANRLPPALAALCRSWFAMRGDDRSADRYIVGLGQLQLSN